MYLMYPFSPRRCLGGPWARKWFVTIALFLHVPSLPAEAKQPKLIPEPNYTDHAQVARWAIARAQFGTLSTTSPVDVPGGPGKGE